MSWLTLLLEVINEVEYAICRIAIVSKSICGIHLHSCYTKVKAIGGNVITGIIKANIPSRIAFGSFFYVDSRTILDTNGAEKLLGKGEECYIIRRYT